MKVDCLDLTCLFLLLGHEYQVLLRRHIWFFFQDLLTF